MKAIVTEKEKKEQKSTFPILMKSKNLNQIVMFFSEEKGLLLYKGNSDCNNYEYAKNWASCYITDIWEPFTGTITLSND